MTALPCTPRWNISCLAIPDECTCWVAVMVAVDHRLWTRVHRLCRFNQRTASWIIMSYDCDIGACFERRGLTSSTFPPRAVHGSHAADGYRCVPTRDFAFGNAACSSPLLLLSLFHIRASIFNVRERKREMVVLQVQPAATLPMNKSLEDNKKW